MKEVEVKILEIDRKKIEKALIDLDAQKIFDGNIQTMLFDFKEGTIVKEKDVLRLRKEQDKTELTYKKVRFTPTAKEAEEYTVDVSNMEVAKKILENLGLSIIQNIEKHRVSYSLDEARFDIDRYSGEYRYIPEFMEIEAQNTELIHKYAQLLGFSPQQCLPWSTNDIIQYYSLKKEATQTQ
jgi:predicted adenylyl cyclase CyaB